MPASADPDTGELLDRSAAGDTSARGRLLDRHRERLRRMVAVRIDPRLAARVDPSDVVQKALAEADARLNRYLRARPLPFYPWLRQLAQDRLAQLYRRHIRAGRRSVGREEGVSLSDRSAAELAERLFARGSSPSRHVIQSELRSRVRAALAALPETDREVLVLRNLEQLSVAVTAGVLGLTEGAVKMRHVRALAKLREALGDLREREA
ncbi:MAG TPA: sigma-70 family RNA polymerase sigma factor [Gemmataceae bacterium]|nr:sigma-70 family RNA polymerase sigma factor [Gemmataceae bacterium]